MRGMKSAPDCAQVSQLPRTDPVFHMPTVQKFPEVKLMPDLLLNVPEPEPLVAPYVYRGQRTLVVGPPGSAKTYVGLEIAIALATGRRAFGSLEVNPCAVLFIEEENDPADLKKRVLRLGGNSPNIAALYRQNVRLNDTRWRDLLSKFVSENNIGLVVMDPLADLHDGDEDSARDMRRVKDCLNLIQKLSARVSFLIFHHPPKAAWDARNGSSLSHARGSGRIVADVDNVVEVLLKSQDGPRTTVTLTVTKYRAGQTPDPVEVTLDFSIPDDFVWTFEPVSKASAKHQNGRGNLEVRLITLLEQGLQIKSRNQAVDILRAKRKTVYELFDHLEETRQIRMGAGGFFELVKPTNEQWAAP